MDVHDPKNRRRAALIGSASLVIGTIVLIVIFLSVDIGDTPPPDTLAPTTIATTTTEFVPDTSPAIDYTPTDPPITPAKSTTTTLPSSIPLDQRITVASPAGLSSVTGTSSSQIDGSDWAVAIRLSDGSVVAQHVWPGYGQPGDTAIYRIANGASESLITPTDATNEWFRLHDVITEGGVDKILYSVKSGTGFDYAMEELFLFDTATRTTELIGTIGGWEDGPGRLSIGRNIIAGETFTQIENAPFLRRRDASTIDPTPYGLAPSYADCAVCPKAFAVDESGTHLAWIEDDVLVVVDLGSGERVANARLLDGLGRDVDSLDVAGNTVIVNAYDRNTGELGRPYVYGFDGTSMQLPVIGRATFDR